jgi:predicted Rdx family selenoprotein
MLREIELRSGVRGVFKVSLDGQLIFDKAEVGHMPEAGEIAKELEKRLGPKLAWRKPR